MGTGKSVRRAICCLFSLALVSENYAIVVDIKTKGAKGDGRTNDGPAIMNAWKDACASPQPSTVLIPSGTYMAFPVVQLDGPCKAPIEIKATGATIKAPPQLAMFGKADGWIIIQNVERLTITGGIFDGQGQETWKANDCAKTGKCQLPANLRLNYVKNSLLRDVTSSNSKFFHFNLLGCDNTNLVHVTVDAPGTSVNTDGIHIGRTNGLNITNTIIKTGDDCISFGDGSKNIHVEKVTCGPGHGISVGSLGRYPEELPVEGIWVTNCSITGTMTGVRIKTWPGSPSGMAREMHFEDIVMDRVGDPILIDQEYCPSGQCQKTTSKFKISNVSFRKIRGTSTTREAITLICNNGTPCENVELADINLRYQGPGGGDPISQCTNVKPKLVGAIFPPACTSAPKVTNYSPSNIV